MAAAAALCFTCALAATDCGFPEYDFGHVGGAGGASSGAGDGAGAAGSNGGAGTGGSGDSAGTAASGAAGEAGASGAGCVFPTPVTFLEHCYDSSVGGGGSGLNCGSTDCAPCQGTESCNGNSDCASNVCSSAKTCTPVLSMTYMSIVADQFTRTPKFSLSIKYLDKLSTPLQDLRIRYYFNHNGVAEPVLAHTQATFDPGNSQRNLKSSELGYRIYRFPPGPADRNGIVTDSYLEITFSSSASLITNAILNLTQDLVAGNTDVTQQFQQSTHYSFFNGGPTPRNTITIYRGNDLVWGLPPPMSLLPDCAFVAGVNLNGPEATTDAQTLRASADALVDYSGATFQDMATLVPPADASTTTMLHTGFTLGAATALWPVPNGKYWAYAWLTSNLGTNSGQLSIQDNATDEFVGSSEGEGWARLGPYAIDVTSGTVKLTGTGAVNIAGAELYRVAE